MSRQEARWKIEYVSSDGRCVWGWKSPRPCNYTGGCVCWKPLGHPGRCKCDTCGSVKQRPANWDARGRAEANA